MASDYIRSAAPDTWTILGLELRPLCLGHLILLERIENEFVKSDGNPGFDDLVSGVWICACTYEEGLWWLNHPTLLKWRLKLWGWQCGTFDINAKLDMFARYMIEQQQFPECWSEENSGRNRTSGIHFTEVIKVSLMSNLGLTESEALNKPLAIALWDHITWCVMQPESTLQVMNDREREAIRLAKEEKCQTS